MPVFKIRTTPYEWAETRDIIANNELARFARSEPDSRKYIAFKQALLKQDLTLFKYLVVNSLKWVDEDQKKRLHELRDDQIEVPPHSAELFYDARDLMVLRNDFPYHFRPGIVHLCVWTRFKIPVDPDSPVGDISAATRRVIERYLVKTFVEKYGIAWDDIAWFKNWEALQAVPSLSHVHVLINGIADAALADVLGSPGVPLTAEELAQCQREPAV